MQNETFTIRRANITDLDAIHQIELLSFSLPWSYQSIKEELTEQDFSRYFVVKQGGVTVGYGGYWRILEEGHITNIAVHPNHRQQGVGEALMRYIATDAAEHAVEALTLEVRVSNMAALHLYQKLGYVIEGVRPRYYSDNNEDAYVMWKRGLYSQPT